MDINNDTNDVDNEDRDVSTTQQRSLNILYESFRIFGFVDDTGFRATAPRRDTHRRLGYSEDVQRAFYWGYFAGHGLKVQAVTLPNGLFGSVFVAPLRVSDAVLQNMSSLDFHLTRLFLEFNKQLHGAGNQLQAVYGRYISTVEYYSSSIQQCNWN